jgi:PAS domain S-box-containing protein
MIGASELSYRRLFETARDGIMILDGETGRILDVKPFLTELVGLSLDEMVGEAVWDLGPFKGIESNQTMLLRLKENGYVRYEYLALQTSTGRKIGVEFVSNVYRADDRDMIQCNVRDITEQKRAEAQVLALGAACDHTHIRTASR